jgi:hypothetical protein
MGQSPFAKRPERNPNLGRRRSSRVDFIIPVIVTGRDASGQSFREVTETRTVNLHGAKILTRHTVLVGMQVGVECPRTGLEGKAVCVRIEPSEADASEFLMAVQLIVPGNLWGVENPPEDWGLEGPTESRRREAPGRSSGVFFAGVRTAGMKEDSPLGPATSPGAASPPALAGIEQRVAGIVERALADFESRLKKLETETQARLAQHGDQALEQLEAFARHFEDRLKHALEERREELAGATEETIRAKVGEMVAAALNSPGAAPPGNPSPRSPSGPKKA